MTTTYTGQSILEESRSAQAYLDVIAVVPTPRRRVGPVLRPAPSSYVTTFSQKNTLAHRGRVFPATRSYELRNAPFRTPQLTSVPLVFFTMVFSLANRGTMEGGKQNFPGMRLKMAPKLERETNPYSSLPSLAAQAGGFFSAYLERYSVTYSSGCRFRLSEAEDVLRAITKFSTILLGRCSSLGHYEGCQSLIPLSR